MSAVVLRNGLVMSPSGPQQLDVGIENGRVTAVGSVDEQPVEIDCGGMWIGPGLVDVHVHLREPEGVP